jgi:hypothetical protein
MLLIRLGWMTVVARAAETNYARGATTNANSSFRSHICRAPNSMPFSRYVAVTFKSRVDRPITHDVEMSRSPTGLNLAVTSVTVEELMADVASVFKVRAVLNSCGISGGFREGM